MRGDLVDHFAERHVQRDAAAAASAAASTATAVPLKVAFLAAVLSATAAAAGHLRRLRRRRGGGAEGLQAEAVEAGVAGGAGRRARLARLRAAVDEDRRRHRCPMEVSQHLPRRRRRWWPLCGRCANPFEFTRARTSRMLSLKIVSVLASGP